MICEYVNTWHAWFDDDDEEIAKTGAGVTEWSKRIHEGETTSASNCFPALLIEGQEQMHLFICIKLFAIEDLFDMSAGLLFAGLAAARCFWLLVCYSGLVRYQLPKLQFVSNERSWVSYEQRLSDLRMLYDSIT
jgi:hypothetical protein